MLSIFDGLRDFTLMAVTVRMLLAVVCGGIIGMERTLHRRPAGFRTHILVCLGAAMTTLTSQYLYLYLDYYTDMARLGAQVVAGIGFLGAGTIVISRQRVRGLTTAAGLWAAAIIGLAVGAGFYEGAILATILPPFLILSILSVFYNAFQDNFLVSQMLNGMQAGVGAVIASVVYDMGRGVLKEKDPLSMVIMAGAFMVVCVFEVNVIYVVIASGLIGAVRTWIQERRAKA